MAAAGGEPERSSLEPEQTTPASALPQDLGPRLASALALGVVALVLTWAGVWPFAIFVLLVALLVAWEWGRVVRRAGTDTIFWASAMAIAMAAVLAALGTPGLGMIVIVAGSILAALLGFGQNGHLSALGVLYAGLPALSLIWLRSSLQWGFAGVLFVFVVVWATDTGAYAAGRTFGGPKLASRISPNKTWAGLFGGIGSAVLVAVIVGAVLGVGHSGRLAITALALALAAQAGDIVESALKREHGVKDASELIPGHGGFMDRVDGLIFAAVLAALWGFVVNVHNPARALLMWN
jgi:phosphatidate cytidylyltransferase